MVKDNYAAVYYFEDEDGHMYLSFNEENEKAITFLVSGEDWTPDAEAVISLDMAISCIEEFLHTGTRPLCIEWQEM